jgi:DNA replication factor GINS
MEETITFDFIRRVQRDEQNSPKLTKLPDNFFDAAYGYIKQKKQMSLRDERKMFLEMKQIERLVEDIFNRRERKILNAAIISARTNIPPENLTGDEMAFFELVVAAAKKRRDDSLRQVIVSEKKEEAELIVFKEDVPAFVGSDMKTYGPFKKGDIAKLPDENMRILVEQGMVEEFKISK